MALFNIDFEWWKDAKGYRLVAAKAATPAKWITPDGFEWKPSLLERVGIPPRIVPNGGKRVPNQPLKKWSELYKAFASVRTAEEALHFVCNYGLLTQSDHGDDVPLVLEHATRFRSWLDANQRPRIGKEGRNFGRVDANLTADPSGALRLSLVPRSLLGALWLQLAHILSEGVKISTCRHCGTWFEAGKSGGQGLRRDAKFCSFAHKQLYHSLKRST
jgi:hypothetical protein